MRIQTSRIVESKASQKKTKHPKGNSTLRKDKLIAAFEKRSEAYFRKHGKAWIPRERCTFMRRESARQNVCRLCGKRTKFRCSGHCIPPGEHKTSLNIICKGCFGTVHEDIYKNRFRHYHFFDEKKQRNCKVCNVLMGVSCRECGVPLCLSEKKKCFLLFQNHKGIVKIDFHANETVECPWLESQ